MRLLHLSNAAIAGLLIAGCAGLQPGVSPEAKAALAPTGKLRVAFIMAPIFASKDPASGELKGVALDLGNDLAGRIGVPFEAVVYPSTPSLVADAKADRWDVAVTGIVAERATAMDYSAPLMESEQGYLVRAGVRVADLSEVDQAGMRIGVLERSGADLHLSRSLKSAALVRVSSIAELSALLQAQDAELIAVSKSSLFAIGQTQPGSRVLDGRIFVEPMGMGVPKGRDRAAAVYVGNFVEDAKAQGLVHAAIQRAGLRGLVVGELR